MYMYVYIILYSVFAQGVGYTHTHTHARARARTRVCGGDFVLTELTGNFINVSDLSHKQGTRWIPITNVLFMTLHVLKDTGPCVIACKEIV